MLLTLTDLERAASERLSAMAWGYYASGADDQITLADNIAAFQRVRLMPRVLVDVSQRAQNTTVLGRSIDLPVLVAPTAMQGLAHARGELATAEAAAHAGTVMVLSTFSNTPIESVAAAVPTWFQLYVYKDRGACKALVRRAEAAGCEALVVTVDAPLLGQRLADIRHGFHLPPELALPNLLDRSALMRSPDAGSALQRFVREMLDPSLSWKDLHWLRNNTALPVLVKGVLRPDDAARAMKAGCAGVIVSNHGGRQLDGAIAAVDALPAIADACEGEVYMDGGVRRGTDVVKALALGARAVLVGRPMLWGLAIEDPTRPLTILREELDRAMALCGAPTVADLTRDLVVHGAAPSRSHPRGRRPGRAAGAYRAED
ncbi:MAG: alpha-hydroxy-acid oxidizing enzyme [Deltaproteobacteria bacterium]|nr:alpha-hydroxy-acid oxidizing enzyme [Deltaproteobacteria bacterium]HCH62471.1 alpha-hydroxy-acid oxidizing enzyme [Deltaproteobacteria bacterium]